MHGERCCSLAAALRRSALVLVNFEENGGESRLKSSLTLSVTGPTSGPLHLWFPLRGKPFPLTPPGWLPLLQTPANMSLRGPLSLSQVSQEWLLLKKNGEASSSMRSSLSTQFKVTLCIPRPRFTITARWVFLPFVAFIILFFQLKSKFCESRALSLLHCLLGLRTVDGT